MRRAITKLLALLICSGAALFAQNASEAESAAVPLSIRATHILGFEGVKNNANGSLSIQGDALQFQVNGRSAVQVKLVSIQDVFLGEQSKQVGGVPMTLGKTAAPFGGGRVVSLFAHKKYDTLALEYVDSNGGVHGAIFELNKGQAEAFENELAARGARVSPSEDKHSPQNTGEVANESK